MIRPSSKERAARVRVLMAGDLLIGWGALTFAALLASFTAFRPVRDALVLDGNPDDIPWLFSATFIAAKLDMLISAVRGSFVEQIKQVLLCAEALRIVDFNERKQEFFCRACRYRDPLGPDGNKLHDDNCPWVEFVRSFGLLIHSAQEPKP